MDKPHKFHTPEIEEEDHDAAEIALQRDLNRILPKDAIIFDVGANRGQFAEQINGFFDQATIHSFEPVPSAYKELEALSSRITKIIPNNLAINVVDGNVDFFITESDVGSSLLEPIEGQPSKWLQTSQKVTVKAKRLDTIIRERNITKIDLLKSDTQGADLQTLLSAGDYLVPSKINAILVEVNFQNFYKNQCSFSSILDTLINKGYRLAWMYPHRSHDKWLWWADALFIAN
jgi:FkbM family methyltransferase